jgi:hypothetical protein
MTHSHKGFFIGLVFGLIIGLLLGCWLCNRGQILSKKTTIKIDTTRYYRPISTPTNELSSKTLQLPKLIFAPADTVVKTIVQTERGDSVEVSFSIEQRVYQDSTYKAVISGAVVGNRRPTLDYIETYNRTTTSEVVLKPKKVRPYIGASVGIFGAWSIGIGGGLLIKDHHAVGAEYARMKNNNLVKLRYNYIF